MGHLHFRGGVLTAGRCTAHGPCCWTPNHHVLYFWLFWVFFAVCGGKWVRSWEEARFSRARTLHCQTLHLAMYRRSSVVSWSDSPRDQAVPESVEAVMEDCTESHQTWNEMLGEQSRSQVETASPAAMGPCAPSEPVPHSSGFVATSEHAVISGWSAGSFSPVQSIPRVDCVETHGFGGVESVTRAPYFSMPSKPVFVSSGLAVTREHAVEAVIPGFFC